MTEDIRWQQRLNNFEQALSQLEGAVRLLRKRDLSELEKQGLIQAFEFTHELAWNLLKDYFRYQGDENITGSRDASRLAFQRGLVSDGEGWMEMIKSRNQTSHTYNRKTADDIVGKVNQRYLKLFQELLTTMKNIRDAN